MASTTHFICSHKTTYTRDEINNAVARALTLLKTDHQHGDGHYPHAYSKSPIKGTHAHVQGPFFSFPIRHEGSHSAEAGASPDRVVFGSVNKDYTSAVYVAVAAADGDSLLPFADTSVNHGRAEAHDFAGHEASEGSALKPLVPSKEDQESQELLTDDDVKSTLLG